MKRRRLSLILAVGLAVAWTGWLGHQALTTADLVVVSRPQVMAAPIVVVAYVDESDSDPRSAKVTKVYRGQEFIGVAAGEPQIDMKIAVHGLQGIKPGSYVLALREPRAGEAFEVMPLPRSPGFTGGPKADSPLIYPATPSTELQVREALRQFQRALQP